MSNKARKFPNWMSSRKVAVGNAIGNIVEGRSLQEVNKNTDDEPANKRRLRSNFQYPKTEAELKPNYNIDDLPMVTYDGRIHYLSDFHQMAEALET